MIPDLASRWIVIGTSGLGENTVADHVGAVLNLPIHDLVHCHASGRKRDETDAKLCKDQTGGAS